LNNIRETPISQNQMEEMKKFEYIKEKNRMKHIHLFENFIGKNDKEANEIIDAMNRLIRSVGFSPSTKDLAGVVEDATSLFTTYGKEKITQVLDELEKLKPKLANKWNPSDEKYLAIDHRGLKHAPTSQISHVIDLVKNYIEEH